MKRVHVVILRAAGTNCDQETAFAFQAVGAEVAVVHINEIIRRRTPLTRFQILAIPGGFTYGDDIASGKIFANELRFQLERDIAQFVKDGKLVIGICNGFQILVKAGLLPGNHGVGTMEATLTVNDSGRFEDRWVHLATPQHNGANQCIWTQGIRGMISLPVAHGEGKFIPKNDDVLQRLWAKGQIVLQYVKPEGGKPNYPWNPNGSVDDIAGICDETGRLFALMPHPERHFLPTHHPRWTREGMQPEGDGVVIFRNGVEFARRYL